jgi:hypothetical protein
MSVKWAPLFWKQSYLEVKKDLVDHKGASKVDRLNLGPQFLPDHLAKGIFQCLVLGLDISP